MPTLFFVISTGHAQEGMVHEQHEHHSAVSTTKDYRRSEASYVVPSVRIVDESGHAVDLPSVLAGDAPVFLNFVFTTCTAVCPIVTATFAQLQEGLGSERDNVRMISLSIDPEQDTPEVLRRYAQKHHAGPRWHFFTGTLSDMISVEKSFDIYRGNKMNHEPVTFVRVGAGSKWMRIDGFASADDLVREYRQLPKPQ
ncbi:MAG: SCO family protein [Gammaproteobacteria bacterium]|nr:SCO family protein [Gammaproteobacteria bacterium]